MSLLRVGETRLLLQHKEDAEKQLADRERMSAGAHAHFSAFVSASRVRAGKKLGHGGF